MHHPLSEQLLKFCALGTSPTSPQTPSLSPPHSSPVFHTLPISGQLLNTIKSVFLVWLTSFPPFHPHDACCLHCDPHLDRCHEPPLPSISTLRPGGDTENASPANYLMGLHSLQDKPQSLLYCVECFRKQNLLKGKQHISSKRKEVMSD